MPVLDNQLRELINDDKKYFNLVSRWTVEELKYVRKINDKGIEKKLTRKEMLEQINQMRIENNQKPYTMYWLDKYLKNT